MLPEARVLGVPVDFTRAAKIEPAQATAERDVGERIAVVVAPRATFEVLFHQLDCAVHARELLVGPGLTALELLALYLVAHQQPGVEHTVGERLPAAHSHAIARLFGDEATERRARVQKFDDHARVV